MAETRTSPSGMSQESPGALVKSDSDPVSLGWGLRSCLSNQLLGGARGGQDHTLRKDLILKISVDSTQETCHEVRCELGSWHTEVTCFLFSSE